MNSNKSIIEDPEYGLDSRYGSKKEYDSEAVALMEARLERMKGLSKEKIIHAKLLQLKLKMEEYLKQPEYDGRFHFTDFLKLYVDAIYPTRNKFAQDINITPIMLSQVINRHREPQDEFIIKLMIHSDKVYKSVCDFRKEIWYQVYFHEKIGITMLNQEEWISQFGKEVKFSEPIN